jgi:very-short-patch-repair endonuclease
MVIQNRIGLTSIKRAAKGKTEFARQLRNNPTPSEEKLWDYLRARKLGYKFSRQAIIFGYIADFWCPEKRLVIEVDGKSHENRREYDAERDTRLASTGIKTVRFSVSDIYENIDLVVAKIQSELNNR